MYTLNVRDPNKLFFTSDTHFDHFNISKLCHRPFTTRKEMNEQLVSLWNSVVPEDGIVVHCGDFTLLHDEKLQAYEKLANKLNGKILLCRGNHDRVPIVINPDTDSKFIAIVDKAMINVDGISIYAEHYPCSAFNGDYQVFGHIHTRRDGLCYGLDSRVNENIREDQYDVGVDQNDYKPISYWELCEILLRKSQKKNYSFYERVKKIWKEIVHND